MAEGQPSSVDRWLAVAGVILALPGFLLLFLSEQQTVGILVLLLAVGFIVAALVIRHVTHRPPFELRNAEVTLKFLDDCGKHAILSKEYRIVPNYGHLQVMTHRNIGADGGVQNIQNICWNGQPVPASAIIEEMGEYVVNITFPFPPPARQEFAGKLSYEARNCFEKNPDGLVYVVDFPTRTVSIRVDFPARRPCKSVRAFQREGAGDKLISSPEISNDGLKLEMKLKHPRVGSELKLWWEW